MISRFSSVMRLVGFALIILVGGTTQAVLMLCRSKTARTFPGWFHFLVLRALGVRVTGAGQINTDGPTLFVANHTSYLDIVILGALIPGSFVSKADVRHWPVFGVLSKLQRTVYIDRRRSSVKTQKSMIEQRLDAGENLILFPEGTSGDGNGVLPFKSALFSVAENKVNDRFVRVQPVSVTYNTLDGFPMGYHFHPYYAWYGNMSMAGHLFRWLGLGALGVVVEFHPPVSMEQFSHRKELADHCQKVVATAVSQTLSGRRTTAAPRRLQQPFVLADV